MTSTARKLSLVSTEDRERPTEPHNLKPSEAPSAGTSVPRLRPPPTDLITAIRALPSPNPDNYTEMSIALLLRGFESQQDLKSMIDGAVDRINWDADARAHQTKADFALTNNEVHKIATSLGHLEAMVRELVPRMGKVEDRLDDGAERFERIEVTMGAMRTQMDRLEGEVAALKGKLQDASGPASTKAD